MYDARTLAFAFFSCADPRSKSSEEKERFNAKMKKKNKQEVLTQYPQHMDWDGEL